MWNWLFLWKQTPPTSPEHLLKSPGKRLQAIGIHPWQTNKAQALTNWIQHQDHTSFRILLDGSSVKLPNDPKEWIAWIGYDSEFWYKKGFKTINEQQKTKELILMYWEHRVIHEAAFNDQWMNSPLIQSIAELPYEQFWVWTKQQGHWRPTCIETGTIKGVGMSNFHTWVDFCRSMGTSNIMLMHNHPSGSSYHSDQDLKGLHELMRDLKDYQVTIDDYIILTKKGFYSFQDNQLLTKGRF